jgi:hypothetical protein
MAASGEDGSAAFSSLLQIFDEILDQAQVDLNMPEKAPSWFPATMLSSSFIGSTAPLSPEHGEKDDRSRWKVQRKGKDSVCTIIGSTSFTEGIHYWEVTNYSSTVIGVIFPNDDAHLNVQNFMGSLGSNQSDWLWNNSVSINVYDYQTVLSLSQYNISKCRRLGFLLDLVKSELVLYAFNAENKTDRPDHVVVLATLMRGRNFYPAFSLRNCSELFLNTNPRIPCTISAYVEEMIEMVNQLRQTRAAMAAVETNTAQFDELKERCQLLEQKLQEQAPSWFPVTMLSPSYIGLTALLPPEQGETDHRSRWKLGRKRVGAEWSTIIGNTSFADGVHYWEVTLKNDVPVYLGVIFPDDDTQLNVTNLGASMGDDRYDLLHNYALEIIVEQDSNKDGKIRRRYSIPKFSSATCMTGCRLGLLLDLVKSELVLYEFNAENKTNLPDHVMVLATLMRGRNFYPAFSLRNDCSELFLNTNPRIPCTISAYVEEMNEMVNQLRQTRAAMAAVETNTAQFDELKERCRLLEQRLQEQAPLWFPVTMLSPSYIWRTVLLPPEQGKKGHRSRWKLESFGSKFTVIGNTGFTEGIHYWEVTFNYRHPDNNTAMGVIFATDNKQLNTKNLRGLLGTPWSSWLYNNAVEINFFEFDRHLIVSRTAIFNSVLKVNRYSGIPGYRFGFLLDLVKLEFKLYIFLAANKTDRPDQEIVLATLIKGKRYYPAFSCFHEVILDTNPRIPITISAYMEKMNHMSNLLRQMRLALASAEAAAETNSVQYQQMSKRYQKLSSLLK